jgi:hypothetical protein
VKHIRTVCIILLLLLLPLLGCSTSNFPLHLASALDRLEHGPVQRKLGADTLSVSEMYPDNPQAQALVKAAIKGDAKEIDRLIDAGADPNAVGALGMTVPGWVLYHPNKEGFRRLLEHGADPNIIWQDEESFYRPSLLHKAVRLSDSIGVDYLKMCLEIGRGNPNLESPDHKHRPIEEAVHPNRNAAFVVLYKAGAEIDFPIDSVLGARSLVQEAAEAWNYRLTLFMLEKGVVYTHGVRGKNDLPYAIQLGLRRLTIPRAPTLPQYMWFWRCVDFLEKRGVVFDYTPAPNREPAIRPAVLDTTPPGILEPEGGK